MAKRHLYILAYDVADPKRLRQALHIARSYATGGQKSVFECWLSDKERKRCWQSLSHTLDARQDRLLLIRLDPRQRIHPLGLAVLPLDSGFYYQG